MLWCKVVVTSVLVLLCMCSLITADRPFWESPGCHLVGYTKVAKVPGCHRVHVEMNACRGYCVTYSHLSPYGTPNGRLFESSGSCCSIQDTHDVIVTLQCRNNAIRQLRYRSAASCTCTLCSISES